MQWEDAKRAGQTAFIDNETVSSLYQQIRTNGHIIMAMGEQSLTQQIAQDIYPPSVADTYVPQRAIDQDIEPER